MIAPSLPTAKEDGHHILQLAHDLLRLGPRTPESTGEREAGSWIEAHLRKLGLHPLRHNFHYPKEGLQIAPLALITPFGLFVTGLVAGYLPPLIVVCLVAAFAGWEFVWLPRLFRSGQLDRFIGDRPGVNLIAGLTRSWDEMMASPRPLVLLTAHYDSAEGQRRFTLDTRALREPFDVLYFFGIVFLLVFYASAGLIGFVAWAIDGSQLTGAGVFWNSFGVWAHLVLVGPFALAMAWSVVAEALQFPRVENPGADDNASGVATLLSVAEQLRHEPPGPQTDIAVAFWGAEEIGLQGSSAFLREFGERIAKDTWVVNIDAVGRPDTLMIMLGGGLRTRNGVSDKAQHIARMTASDLGMKKVELIWLSFLSGATDQAVWLQAGYQNTISISHGGTHTNLFINVLYKFLGISTGSKIPDWAHAHTPADDASSLSPVALAHTKAYVLKLARRLAENE